MTALAQATIDEAYTWLRKGCKETVTNGGSCVDQIHIAFDGDRRREAWCAKFAYVCTAAAAKRLGVTNLLPHTPGAALMRDMAIKEKKLRVDTTPAPGAVFYRASAAAGATGHIGVVISVSADRIDTIEGNVSNSVVKTHYTMADLAAPKNKFKFIHTEEMGGGAVRPGAVPSGSSGGAVASSSSMAPILLVVGAAVALYAGYTYAKAA